MSRDASPARSRGDVTPGRGSPVPHAKGISRGSSSGHFCNGGVLAMVDFARRAGATAKDAPAIAACFTSLFTG